MKKETIKLINETLEYVDRNFKNGEYKIEYYIDSKAKLEESAPQSYANYLINKTNKITQTIKIKSDFKQDDELETYSILTFDLQIGEIKDIIEDLNRYKELAKDSVSIDEQTDKEQAKRIEEQKEKIRLIIKYLNMRIVDFRSMLKKDIGNSLIEANQYNKEDLKREEHTSKHNKAYLAVTGQQI